MDSGPTITDLKGTQVESIMFLKILTPKNHRTCFEHVGSRHATAAAYSTLLPPSTQNRRDLVAAAVSASSTSFGSAASATTASFSETYSAPADRAHKRRERVQARFAEDVCALQLQREVLAQVVGLVATAAGERLVDEDVRLVHLVRSVRSKGNDRNSTKEDVMGGEEAARAQRAPTACLRRRPERPN